MKILIISDLFEIEKDKTIPSVVKDFAKGFLDFGHEVFVLRPNFLINSIIRKHKIIKNGEYFVQNIRIFNRNFFLPFLKEDKKFLKFLNSLDFDLIISHMPSGHLYKDLINKTLKKPTISIVHQSDYRVLADFKYCFFKKRLKKALLNSNLIGARNVFLKNYFKADFLLPSYIEKEFVLEKKKKPFEKKLKILTLSKLIKRKNIDLIIKALKKVDFDFQFDIFGEGKEKRRLEKLIEKYDLNNKIKIYPYIEHKKIYDLLDDYDIFALVSKNETFGLSYLEALSRGLIVIGTKDTGIDGVVEDNKNGFLINPIEKDLESVMNKIFNLNKEEKEKLSENSISSIKEKYTKEKVMEEYLKKIARF